MRFWSNFCCCCTVRSAGVLQKGKGGGGAKLFHALGQTEGLPGRVQDGTALGAQIGETLEPIFPLGKGLFQDT